MLLKLKVRGPTRPTTRRSANVATPAASVRVEAPMSVPPPLAMLTAMSRESGTGLVKRSATWTRTGVANRSAFSAVDGCAVTASVAAGPASSGRLLVSCEIWSAEKRNRRFPTSPSIDSAAKVARPVESRLAVPPTTVPPPPSSDTVTLVDERASGFEKASDSTAITAGEIATPARSEDGTFWSVMLAASPASNATVLLEIDGSAPTVKLSTRAPTVPPIDS